jgi:uncharacterized membrane protein
MSWLSRYRVRRHVYNSLWPIPAAAIPVAMAVQPLIRLLDARTQWRLLGYSPEGARALVGGLAPTALTLIALFLSTLLLSVQIAASQYSPRLISGMLANRQVKGCLAVFVFSYVYCVGALGRIDSRVPQLPVVMAIVSSIASVGAGLYLIDHIAKELRPVRMLARTADVGRAAIAQCYPHLFGVRADTLERASRPAPPGQFETITHAGTPEVLQAIDVAGLFALAVEGRCVIEVVPHVGDFVTTGDPLFRVHPPLSTLDARRLRASVAFGKERTAEQDPVFPFRILVDVASKALSPAINDPTTAVLAIDQVHSLLREVGKRRLDAGAVRDLGGDLRLVYHAPDWDDFVLIAATEIRQYGGDSFQVARRLRAMLKDLVAVLPESRTPILQEQLRLLDSGVERSFEDPEDRTRACTSDSQGVGSSRGAAPEDTGYGGVGPTGAVSPLPQPVGAVPPDWRGWTKVQ